MTVNAACIVAGLGARGLPSNSRRYTRGRRPPGSLRRRRENANLCCAIPFRQIFPNGTKPDQTEPNKTKKNQEKNPWISLDSFVRNGVFQGVTAIPTQKIHRSLPLITKTKSYIRPRATNAWQSPSRWSNRRSPRSPRKSKDAIVLDFQQIIVRSQQNAPPLPWAVPFAPRTQC
jgi:hypothetical protein